MAKLPSVSAGGVFVSFAGGRGRLSRMRGAGLFVGLVGVGLGVMHVQLIGGLHKHDCVQGAGCRSVVCSEGGGWAWPGSVAAADPARGRACWW